MRAARRLACASLLAAAASACASLLGISVGVVDDGGDVGIAGDDGFVTGDATSDSAVDAGSVGAPVDGAAGDRTAPGDATGDARTGDATTGDATPTDGRASDALGSEGPNGQPCSMNNYRRVFVTSLVFSGSELMGVGGANAKCQSAAPPGRRHAWD